MNRIIAIVFLLIPVVSTAQRQLVLLKDEEVMLRLDPGDDFVYRLKGSDQIRRTYVNNLFDSAILTHTDTIPIHQIERVYFRHISFANRVGLFLTVGGAGYFLVDQINNVIVHGNEASLDESVTTTSAVMVGIGLPMMLSGRKYKVIRGRKRLMIVDEKSPFYFRPSSSGFQSPYIPK